MISKARQIILSVSIAIVFALFIGYGISTFYKSPKYEEFCPDELSVKSYTTKVSCEKVGGYWTESTYVCPPDETKPCEPGYCNTQFTCSKNYDAKIAIYDQNVFIICLILGLCAIIIGGIFLSVESVGSGLMGGGVLTVVYGTIRYWGHAPDVLRFTILGIVLFVLIWMGYKKLNPKLEKTGIKKSLGKNTDKQKEQKKKK
jgi:preprotein translocase subunit SecG